MEIKKIKELLHQNFQMTYFNQKMIENLSKQIKWYEDRFFIDDEMFNTIVLCCVIKAQMFLSKKFNNSNILEHQFSPTFKISVCGFNTESLELHIPKDLKYNADHVQRHITNYIKSEDDKIRQTQIVETISVKLFDTPKTELENELPL